VIVAIARLGLRISYSHSLKDKRRAIRTIKDRTRARHDVHVVEVDAQDKWQRAVLGFAVVGSDRVVAERVVDKVVTSIEEMAVAEIIADDREIIYFGDEEAAL
jgi:uncharacterized protein YlxP (DUF503 family)